MKQKQLTKNQALRKLCPEGGQHLGDNNVTYGDRDNYLRVSLSVNGTSGHYELVRMKHVRGGQAIDQWTVDITDNQHRPRDVRQDLSMSFKGGYFWTEDGKFYCWMPINVAARVVKVLAFTGVMSLATEG